MLMTNILSRVIAGVVTLVLLTGIRLYFAYYVFNQVRALHTDPAYRARYHQATELPRPPAFPDHSSWLLFNSGDPNAGPVTRHAKLPGTSADASPGQTLPASSLELTAAKGAGNHVFLTLPGLLPCANLTALDAVFDKHPPTRINVSLVDGPKCILEIADADSFVRSLQDADTLVIQRSTMPAAAFSVSGLSWD